MCLKLEIEVGMVPVGIYLFKVNIENNRAMWKICSKLTIKIVKQIHLPVVFIFTHCSGVFIVDFGKVNAGWELYTHSANHSDILGFLSLTLNMYCDC